MPTPEQRREVLKECNLCLHLDCRAHDDAVDAILAFRDKAVLAEGKLWFDTVRGRRWMMSAHRVGLIGSIHKDRQK